MPATDKTERLSAADFRGLSVGKGKRKVAADTLPVLTVFPLAPTATLRSYSLTYSGPGLSSNKWYAGMHWRKRQELKEEWHKRFHPLLVASGIEAMERFKVALHYRARLDADNCTAMLKLLIDSLKGWLVPEDSPKYFKGFSVEFDENLPHNTFIFIITEQV